MRSAAVNEDEGRKIADGRFDPPLVAA